MASTPSDLPVSGQPYQMMGNDLVVREESCNLGCEYCLTGQSNLKASHANQAIFEPPTSERYARGTEFGERIHSIVDRIRKGLRTPLLKVTGGEIFIIKDMIDFLKSVSMEHAVLVVQTNGLPLTAEKIQTLVSFGNVVVQISLDSSSYAGNQYRLRSQSTHEKLLERIHNVAAAGLPLEIYGVINDKSVEYLEEFVHWCSEFPADNKPQLFPFPVRGPSSERFKIRPDQWHHIDRLLEMQPQYADVLPPVPYLKRLVSFYRDGGRSWRCHLPRLVVSSFDDGIVTPCPNIWFNKLGNVTEGEGQETLHAVGTTPFYELLLAPRPRIDACKGCLTPWDTLSLYFEDEITLDELCRAPSYAVPEVRDFLVKKKAAYRAGAPEAGPIPRH